MKNKGLAMLLATVIGAGVTFSSKANADFVIDYSNSVTQVNADGQGTFGSDSNDYYQVSLRVYNHTIDEGSATGSATNLIYNTDLETRGAYDIHDVAPDGNSYWTFDSSPTGQDRYNFNGINLEPAFGNTLNYKVKANDVLGWEKTEVYLDSNGGERATIDATVPTIPEPSTMGLIALLGAGTLAFRRFFRF